MRLRGDGIALLDTDTLLDDDDPHERAMASGTASDLLLALWGRVAFDVLETAGDPRCCRPCAPAETVMRSGRFGRAAVSAS